MRKYKRSADIVSSRITELLGEKTFQFSPVEIQNIHRRFFEGVFDHAGQSRTYNITKKEWILNGDTVIYALWNSIRDTLDYDFQTERQFFYEGMDIENEAFKDHSWYFRNALVRANYNDLKNGIHATTKIWNWFLVICFSKRIMS